jgi:hypothetical protein
MPSFPRVRDLDTQTWRTATLSAPFVVQIVLGFLLLAVWALGNGLFKTESGHSERVLLLTATLITTLTSLVFSVVLLMSPSPRRRGLSLSLAGSSAVVLVGGTIYAYLVLR